MKKDKRNILILTSLTLVVMLLFCGCGPEELPENEKPRENQIAITENMPSGEQETELGVYVEEFSDGKFNGSGEFTFEHDGIGVYNGNYSDSMRDGYGVFEWTDGDKYDGNWLNDKMSGDGVYTFADGGIITGKFKENMIISGTYEFSDDNKEDVTERIIYWKSNITDNVLSGKVLFKTLNGTDYSGDIPFKDVEAKAEITYSSGNKYTGDIKNFKRNGNGIFEWHIGEVKIAVYSGSWINDEMSGDGAYYYSSGEYPRLEGLFEANLPVDICIYYQDEEISYETVWKDGVCVSIKEK